MHRRNSVIYVRINCGDDVMSCMVKMACCVYASEKSCASRLKILICINYWKRCRSMSECVYSRWILSQESISNYSLVCSNSLKGSRLRNDERFPRPVADGFLWFSCRHLLITVPVPFRFDSWTLIQVYDGSGLKSKREKMGVFNQPVEHDDGKWAARSSWRACSCYVSAPGSVNF